MGATKLSNCRPQPTAYKQHVVIQMISLEIASNDHRTKIFLVHEVTPIPSTKAAIFHHLLLLYTFFVNKVIILMREILKFFVKTNISKEKRIYISRKRGI